MIETDTDIIQKTQQPLPASLDDIRGPIADELKKFRVFFKDALHTDVLLLNKIIAYLLKTKGKELRPILVFHSARLCGGITQRTHIAAAMIELLHTATLIHDDVVDDAERRRGFLSIPKIFKNKASVLLGDFLLARGLLIALDNHEYQLLQVISTAVKRMSEGELRQLKAAGLQNMTREKYFEIISDKTGSLITACCETGAISSSDDEEKHLLLREIGEHIGVAFQIKDDLFDYGGEDTGKPLGNDIRERKVTLPLIAALEQSDKSDQRHIRHLFRKRKKKKADVDEIVQFVRQNGGMTAAQEEMNRYAEHAFELLRKFPASKERDDVEHLIRFVITRRK